MINIRIIMIIVYLILIENFYNLFGIFFVIQKNIIQIVK